MLYSEIKREVLGHINQYSVAGTPVAASYNNQSDYLNRIPVLVNEGLVNVRTFVKPDPVVYTLRGGQQFGNMLRFELPNDFWSLRSGGVSVATSRGFHKTNDYRLQGKKYILVPKDSNTYMVEYYKYPDLLPLDKTLTDSFDLDEDIEVIQAATYYAAANLVMMEDEFAYASLYNDYESRLSRISPGITTEVHGVSDSYNFNTGWY